MKRLVLFQVALLSQCHTSQSFAGSSCLRLRGFISDSRPILRSTSEASARGAHCPSAHCPRHPIGVESQMERKSTIRNQQIYYGQFSCQSDLRLRGSKTNSNDDRIHLQLAHPTPAGLSHPDPSHDEKVSSNEPRWVSWLEPKELDGFQREKKRTHNSPSRLGKHPEVINKGFECLEKGRALKQI